MKNKGVLIAVVVIVVIAVGAFAIFNKKPTSKATPVENTTESKTTADVPSDNIYLVKTDPAKEEYLTDFEGMTLYFYDKDEEGVSNCDKKCILTWRPYTSGAAFQSSFPKNITVITHQDESTQFAWKGKPLYYHAYDKKPGDMKGDGAEGVWHIAKP